MNPAILKALDGTPVPLRKVKVEGRLDGLLSEVTLIQQYVNEEPFSIEAVYTFPLPLDAVLLEFTVGLNGEQLTGRVFPAAQAETGYEEAIEEGDSAALLTETRPGLYSLNLGNLFAGETAEIRLRYGQLHRWNGDRLRFHLPTTLAPLYGDPRAAGLLSRQIPEQTLAPAFEFSLDLIIEGSLAAAELFSPTHSIEVGRGEGRTRIWLSRGEVPMDRDFVLVLERPEELTGVGLVAGDGEQQVALASFHPNLPDREAREPRCFKLVVDCSGSMMGESIAQARQALQEILRRLEPGDGFNLIAFGSTWKKLFPRAVPADEKHLDKAHRFLEVLNADMGGTELGAALEAALKDKALPGLPADVLLITDGQVWEYQRLLRTVEASGHRLFVVGVGHAINEPVLRSLAEHSGGACELVTPGEEMAGRIVRHFERMRQPAFDPARVRWPAAPIHQAPATLGPVYRGDTLHCFAWLPSGPVDQARLELGEGENQYTETVAFQPLTGKAAENLVRIGAHARLSGLEGKEALELALQYGLLCQQTSYLLVKEREEKSEELPRLRKVPHALAAGWGGRGHVMAAALNGTGSAGSLRFMMEVKSPLVDQENWTERFVAALEKVCDRWKVATLLPFTLPQLEQFGVPPKVVEALQLLVDEGYGERMVVIAWLRAFLDAVETRDVPRNLQWLVRRAAKELGVPKELYRRVKLIWI